MLKRNYTHVKKLLPAIQEKAEQGMTQREIAEYYGFKDKMVVKRLLDRERKKERTGAKSRGRKPAKTLQEYRNIRFLRTINSVNGKKPVLTSNQYGLKC